MKVTVCEMQDDRDEFAETWEGLSRHVKSEGTDLLLLPEMPFYGWFCSGAKFEQPVWDDAVGSHRRWAEKIPSLGARNVLWTSPVELGGRRYNQAFVWTKDRGAKGVHIKNYIPNEEGFYEARWFEPGSRTFEPFDAGGLRMGFLVCSELWAMPRARAYGKSGADLLAVPRTTSAGSVDKWMAGGRTASVVSGAYCASSNRSGKREGMEFGGCGWVFGPDGEVLGATSKEQPFLTVEVDPGAARRAKKTYPRDALEPD